MKGFNIILFVVIMLICCDMSFGATEDTTMIQIQNNTRDTAENTTKGIMEYVTFVVVISTLIISCITLYYSKRTKDLQEKTERNTRRISLKHERTTLRQISWSLLKAFNNLTTIETVLKAGFTPASVNFLRMKVDVAELHINDSFDYEIDGKGTQILYRLYSLIKDFNSLLDRRSDQSNYRTIRENHNTYGYRLSDLKYDIKKEPVVGWIAKHKKGSIYFSEEKNTIYAILKTIDELYPFLFSVNEKKYDDSLENKVYLLQHSNDKYEYLQNDQIITYNENYECKSGITLDSCKDILNTEEADKYFPLMFVYYYNRVCPQLKEYLDHQKDTDEKDEDDNLETNEVPFAFPSNGLLSTDKRNKNMSHRLPVIDNYIEEVLKLIDYEVADINSIENRDIFISPKQTSINEFIKKEPTRVEISSTIPKDNLIDVFDPVTFTLYLYANKSLFKDIVWGKAQHFSYIIDEKNLPLFFKHENGQIQKNIERPIKSFQDGMNILNKEKMVPYVKNDIKFLTLTYIAQGCNDSVTLKIKKIKYSPTEEGQKMKAVITFDEIISFNRR